MDGDTTNPANPIQKDNIQLNALRRLCKSGKTDFVRYLINSPTFCASLVLSKDEIGRTTLHHAANKNIASILIESVEVQKAQSLIFMVDHHHQTALHVACIDEKDDVVEYLASCCLAWDELLLIKDDLGRTALHNAADKSTATIIMQTVQIQAYQGLLHTRDIFSQTVLHKAAKSGQTDLLEYFLSFADDDLVCECDKWGRTALHYAVKEEVAELLVDFVSPMNWIRFVLCSDLYQQSILHKAAEYGHSDVVTYICSHICYESLILQTDQWGRTALHYVRNRDIAQIVLRSVPYNKRSDFVKVQDIYGMTALHIAAENGRLDVVDHLFMALLGSNSKAEESFDVIDTTEDKTSKRAFILALKRDNLPDQCASNNLTPALLQNCHIISHDFLLQIDEYGCKNILELHSQSGILKVICYNILAIDEEKHGMLDIIKLGVRPSIVYRHVIDDNLLLEIAINEKEQIPSFSSDADEEPDLRMKLLNVFKAVLSTSSACDFISIKDEQGRTALHHADNYRIARSLIAIANSKMEYINCEDNDGETAISVAIKRGRCDVVNGIFQYVEKFSGASGVKLALLKKNIYGQNAFHLAAISPLLDRLYSVLEHYIHLLDGTDILVPDVYGNTPLQYIVARSATKQYADIIMTVPLTFRQHNMRLKNSSGTDCFNIITKEQFSQQLYFKSVLCDQNGNYFHKFFHCKLLSQDELLHPEDFITHDGDLMKVVKYALNEYSLVDTALTIPHISCAPVLSTTSALMGSSTDENMLNPKWLIVDADAVESDRLSVQTAFNNLDVPSNHGKPKVIVTHTSQVRTLHLVPPGPDCLIISVQYCKEPGTHDKLDKNTLTSVDHLLTELRANEFVQSISVNSTLSKRPHRDDLDLQRLQAPYIIRGANRGRALIICNSHNRDGWQREYECNQTVLEHQFGLEVTSLFNLTSDEMIKVVSDFSQSQGHESIVVLAILSHGDLKGNIKGDDGESACSVQSILDAFCVPELEKIPKVVLLTFCRGSIGMPKVNRTSAAWECTVLPDLLQSLSVSPVRRSLDSHTKEEEWKRQPFPTADVPRDCYVLFSTLPDSKSSRGLTMEVISDHLTDISRLHFGAIQKAEGIRSTKRLHSSLPSANVETELYTRDGELTSDTKSQGAEAAQNVDCETDWLRRVELINLFTDVAGIVREKSNFTQHMNHCYTIDRNSKPIVIEILPCKADTEF